MQELQQETLKFYEDKVSKAIRPDLSKHKLNAQHVRLLRCARKLNQLNSIPSELKERLKGTHLAPITQ
jgi:hypothetical protein